MTVVKTLQRMKEVLMERGWHQGDYIDLDTGSICILGAHNIVVYEDAVAAGYDEDEEATVKALTLMVYEWNYDNIPAFNDAGNRTFNEVISLIDSTIINEKEKLA